MVASLKLDQNKLNTIRNKSTVVAGLGINLFNDLFLQDSKHINSLQLCDSKASTQETTCFKNDLLYKNEDASCRWHC